MKFNLIKTNYMNWKVFKFVGSFTVSSLPLVRQEFEIEEKEGTKKIAFDLSDLSFVDSSAIGILTNFSKRTKTKGGKVASFGARDDVADILNMVSFEENVEVYPSKEGFERVNS